MASADAVVSSDASACITASGGRARVAARAGAAWPAVIEHDFEHERIGQNFAVQQQAARGRAAIAIAAGSTNSAMSAAASILRMSVIVA